jgi:hypothetical protein
MKFLDFMDLMASRLVYYLAGFISALIMLALINVFI